MKSFKEFTGTVFSTKNVGIYIFVITTILLTAILSSRYYLHHSIIENGISKKDIVANRTIKLVDIDKTNKLKQEIAKKVLPISVPIQDDFIRNNLDKAFENVAVIRDAKIPQAEKVNQLIIFFNLSILHPVYA